MIQTTIPQVQNCCWNHLLPGVEETHTKQLKIQTHPVYNCSEEGIPIEEGKWKDILVGQQLRGNTIEAEVSKLVMRLVRHYDKHKKKQTALFIGNRWVQNCEKRSRRPEGKQSRTLIGFSIFTKEATKRGSSVARIPERSYCTFVLFKDTLVGT